MVSSASDLISFSGGGGGGGANPPFSGAPYCFSIDVIEPDCNSMIAFYGHVSFKIPYLFYLASF